MKKLPKIQVKSQAETLSQDEMKLIMGGGMYVCCCDRYTCNPQLNYSSPIEASTLTGAKNKYGPCGAYVVVCDNWIPYEQS